MRPKIFPSYTANDRFYIVSHMLLWSSTSRRMVWSQKSDARNRPSSVWVKQSEGVYHSTTRRDDRFGSGAAVFVQQRSCQPHGVYVMQKNVRRFRSWIYTSRTNHYMTSVRTRATTRRWLPMHSKNSSPSSTAAMQWIITLIHTTVIQCIWRRRSRRTQ